MPSEIKESGKTRWREPSPDYHRAVIDAVLYFCNRIADKWILVALFVFLIVTSRGGDFFEKAAFIVLGCLVNIMQQRRGVARPTEGYGREKE